MAFAEGIKPPEPLTRVARVAELLIVVAIIGVLAAISIPILTAQLKKARLAANQANTRAAYAAAVAERLVLLFRMFIIKEGHSLTCCKKVIRIRWSYFSVLRSAALFGWI
ncbi:MAG: hypothetical protein U0L49_11025 [Eubacterium sp.]|nr:hypothetical protein [Eubacterium sp.]